jgi:hypothetical protein
MIITPSSSGILLGLLNPEDDRTTILQLVAVYQFLRSDNPETLILNLYKPLKPTKLIVNSLSILWKLSALVVV